MCLSSLEVTKLHVWLLRAKPGAHVANTAHVSSQFFKVLAFIGLIPNSPASHPTLFPHALSPFIPPGPHYIMGSGTFFSPPSGAHSLNKAKPEHPLGNKELHHPW